MHVVFRLPSFGRVWNDGPRWQSRWGIVCGSFNYYLMQQGIADLQSDVHTNELTVGWWKSRCVCVTVWCQFVIITMNSCLCPISARYSFIFYRHEFKGESRGQKDKSWQELQLFDTRLYYNKWLGLCCSLWLILNTLPTPSFSCQCQYKKNH